MKVEMKKIKIKDIFFGYKDNGEKGVVGYGGMLDIRPPYQREFIYNEEQMKSVINTILEGENDRLTYHYIYWVDKEDGSYELLDGQQRILSIMKFLDNKYAIDIDGHSYYCSNLSSDKFNKIMDYQLWTRVIIGTSAEKIDLLKIVNVGVELYVEPYAKLRKSDDIFYLHSCLLERATHQLENVYIKGKTTRKSSLDIHLYSECLLYRERLLDNEALTISLMKISTNKYIMWKDLRVKN